MTPKQAEAKAAVEMHGSISAAARELGISRSSLRDRIKRDNIPLSESAEKFRPEWTAQDCVAELQRIAMIDPEKVISRNYFRNHSAISESTWNRYFGTFHEFKAQAEITLSRHAHQLERHIAKHASVDKRRAMNGEKVQWESAYLRPSSARFQTAIVASDLHDINCDPFYRRVLIDMIQRVQPEKVVLNGDVVDLQEFSKHFRDPRSFNLVNRLQWLHALIADIRNAAPNAEIIYIEGNHEFRLLRHLTEQTPAMMVLLSDLHGMTVSSLFGLDKYEVNYIAKADMTAWDERGVKDQLRKNYILLWESMLFGHFPEMRSMGYPGANGHHHKHVVIPAYSPQWGPFEWHQTGCGHLREASYCSGEKWGNGFLLAHCDTHMKRSQFEYVDLSHEHAFVGGKLYLRDECEPVIDKPRIRITAGIGV